MAFEYEFTQSESRAEQSVHIPRGAARAFGTWFLQTNTQPFAEMREGLSALTEAQLTGDIRDIKGFPGTIAVQEMKGGYDMLEEFLLTMLSAPSIRTKAVKGGYRLAYPYFHGDFSQALRPVKDGTYLLNHEVFGNFNTAFSHEISTAGTPISGYGQLLNTPDQPQYIRQAAQLVSAAQDLITESVRRNITIERQGNMNSYPDALVLHARNGVIRPIPVTY